MWGFVVCLFVCCFSPIYAQFLDLVCLAQLNYIHQNKFFRFGHQFKSNCVVYLSLATTNFQQYYRKAKDISDMHIFQRPEPYDQLTFNSEECWYFNYVKKTIDQEMMNQSQKYKYV